MSQLIAAIDPGNQVSAYLEWNGACIEKMAIAPNDQILKELTISQAELLLIEQITSYGQVVGQSIFDTCFWSGRFAQAWEHQGKNTLLVSRKDIKLHHCGKVAVGDSDIRSELIAKYGKPGTKKAPGLTYGLKTHLWAAFALASFYTENPELAA